MSTDPVWSPLAYDQAIAVRSGFLYAVVASVKNSHSAADIRSLLTTKYGLQIGDYQDPAPGPSPDGDGYRLVALQAMATRTLDQSIPWAVPSPLSLFDSSRILRGWSAPPAAPLATPGASVAPRPSGAIASAASPGAAGGWIVMLGAVLFGALMVARRMIGKGRP
jgi:hypothetical protein